WLPQQRCTVAQLSADAKNRISHRAQAAQHLLALLRTNWG
ncbi:MAG: non-canonical purine NTP pyrophosphatase, partial [Betaproteobacteria bacterium]|nr:non-canonical purine NTP pyrophosphatase [Betaproteobacteria bacterium]